MSELQQCLGVNCTAYIDDGVAYYYCDRCLAERVMQSRAAVATRRAADDSCFQCAHSLDEYHSRDGCSNIAPAIESDPACSEALFLEWCAKNDYEWEMGSNSLSGGPFIECKLLTSGFIEFESVSGATPSEARARCIVKAGESIAAQLEK